MRRKPILIVSLIFLAMSLTACGTGALAQVEQPEARTIQVTGKSQVFTTPDIARITIGVRTEGEEAAEAVARNNVDAQAMIDKIQEMGVDEKDIQTTNFSIYLRYEYDDHGRTKSATYVVENSVLVTIRELDKWEKCWTKWLPLGRIPFMESSLMWKIRPARWLRHARKRLMMPERRQNN
jgi:uncharacterized protein YggE